MAAWRARPVWAAFVRVLAVAIPVAASVAVALALGHGLTWPAPRSLPWWAAVLSGAVGTSLVVGRLARRLLPLATLLRLSLVFPDRTPSRFGVALRSGTVNRLRREMASVRAHGVGDDVDEAVKTVLVLAAALNEHDPLTRGHSERVRAFTDLLAEELHLSPDSAAKLRWSALLHDCGKLTVHPEVLNKGGALTDEEWEAVRRHPEEGAKLTLPLRGWLGPWALAIEEHHERWDGEGYPNGLARDELSFGARIVAVADAYEVMTASRSYKSPLTAEAARAELAAGAGHQFDPEVVRAFLALSLGRAGWLTGALGWLGGLAAVRQVSVRTPAGGPGVAAAAAAVGLAALFGFLAPAVNLDPPATTARAPRQTALLPAAEPIAASPAEAPAAVLGVQFRRPPQPAATTTTTAPPVTTSTSAPPPTVAPAVTPPATGEPCTAQARMVTARTPADSVLERVRAGKVQSSNNPNCAPQPPGG
jgi:HD-GYP domain-containing protein (c-di-GMP phosphodiesterase class II)